MSISGVIRDPGVNDDPQSWTSEKPPSLPTASALFCTALFTVLNPRRSSSLVTAIRREQAVDPHRPWTSGPPKKAADRAVTCRAAALSGCQGMRAGSVAAPEVTAAVRVHVRQAADVVVDVFRSLAGAGRPRGTAAAHTAIHTVVHHPGSWSGSPGSPWRPIIACMDMPNATVKAAVAAGTRYLPNRSRRGRDAPPGPSGTSRSAARLRRQLVVWQSLRAGRPSCCDWVSPAGSGSGRLPSSTRGRHHAIGDDRGKTVRLHHGHGHTPRRLRPGSQRAFIDRRPRTATRAGRRAVVRRPRRGRTRDGRGTRRHVSRSRRRTVHWRSARPECRCGDRPLAG